MSGFSFIDLFAGIGSLRRGFEGAGGRCVYTSEWNPKSQQTYRANFPHDGHGIDGDITKVDAAAVPDHDVLLAGFFCQPFSIAGVSARNSLGRAHGFACEAQGTLFFDVARILREKRPAAFLLENVRNLVSHDGGNTFRVIRGVLEEELGYRVSWRVINSRSWVPQSRNRVFIAGFRDHGHFSLGTLLAPRPARRPPGVLQGRPGGHQCRVSGRDGERPD